MRPVRIRPISFDVSISPVPPLTNKLLQNLRPVGVEEMDTIVKPDEVGQLVGEGSPHFWDLVQPVVLGKG